MPTIVEVFFDDGCELNPGDGYGSYEVCSRSDASLCHKVSRQKFGRMTNNMAEWNALLCALEWLEGKPEAVSMGVEIATDSMLVCQQLQGNWRCKRWYLRELRDQCSRLLARYPAWNIRWHRRDANVTRFGH